MGNSLIRTALGIHRCNSALDYALKTRLGGETRESYEIMHKAHTVNRIISRSGKDA